PALLLQLWNKLCRTSVGVNIVIFAQLPQPVNWLRSSRAVPADMRDRLVLCVKLLKLSWNDSYSRNIGVLLTAFKKCLKTNANPHEVSSRSNVLFQARNETRAVQNFHAVTKVTYAGKDDFLDGDKSMGGTIAQVCELVPLQSSSPLVT